MYCRYTVLSSYFITVVVNYNIENIIMISYVCIHTLNNYQYTCYYYYYKSVALMSTVIIKKKR